MGQENGRYHSDHYAFDDGRHYERDLAVARHYRAQASRLDYQRRCIQAETARTRSRVSAIRYGRHQQQELAVRRRLEASLQVERGPRYYEHDHNYLYGNGRQYARYSAPGYNHYDDPAPSYGCGHVAPPVGRTRELFVHMR